MQLRIQPVELARHLQRCLDRMVGVGRIGDRRTPEGHDRVADIFVERAALGTDRAGHRREEAVDQGAQIFRSQLFGDPGEVAHVAEHDGQHAVFGAHVIARRVARHLLDELWRHVGSEQTRQRAPVAALDDVRPDRQPHVQEQREQQRRRHRKDQPERAVGQQVAGDQNRQQHEQQLRRADGAQPGQQADQQRRDAEKLCQLEACRPVGLPGYARIEQAGQQVGVYLDAREHLGHRCRSQVEEPRH